MMRSDNFRFFLARPGASVAEIKAEYRMLALRHHPDCGGSMADFIAVQAEYEQLLRWAEPEPEPSVTIAADLGQAVELLDLAKPGRRVAYSVVWIELDPECPMTSAPTIIIIDDIARSAESAREWLALSSAVMIGILVRHNLGANVCGAVSDALAEEIESETGIRPRQVHHKMGQL